jgi:predicted Zn-dependent protease
LDAVKAYRDNVKPLEMPDAHYLSSAIGWLGLGNCQEASHELEKIRPRFRAHPEVMTVRFEILGKEGKWEEAAGIAKGRRDANPKEPQWWISLAYATRRKPDGGLDSAKQILTEAQMAFPREPIIAYNLACYECQLGEMKGAWTWLKKAFDLGDPRKFKRMALGDPDLKPLWPELSAL